MLPVKFKASIQTTANFRLDMYCVHHCSATKFSVQLSSTDLPPKIWKYTFQSDRLVNSKIAPFLNYCQTNTCQCVSQPYRLLLEAISVILAIFHKIHQTVLFDLAKSGLHMCMLLFWEDTFCACSVLTLSAMKLFRHQLHAVSVVPHDTRLPFTRVG